MASNQTKKKLLKALANAPATAARKALETMTAEERAEALRICAALGIDVDKKTN
jgi:hypothetical protein